MTQSEWARQEITLACKRENPDWDGKSFDYGCACYQSALKAYESLMSDEHSGYSFSITKNILIRLMDGNPLSAIVDEDFFINGRDDDDWYSSEYLKERGLKSQRQCPRKSSLFRYEHDDGHITYQDIHRAYCINVENERETFNGWTTKVIDELFPITMPYMPTHERYKVYVYTFLCDAKNGDFDHQGIQKIVTPDGREINVDDWYFKEVDGKFQKISKQEFFDDMKHRIDTPQIDE